MGRELPQGEFTSPKAFESRKEPIGACPYGHKPGYEEQKKALEARL